MTLRFSDGVEINPRGPWRKIELRDGWYVVGMGSVLPVEDEAAADRQLARLRGDPPPRRPARERR